MKSKNLIESFNNAINGIIHALKTERNMKIHFAAAIAVLILSLLFKLTKVEFLIVCIAISIVIICELFNTAIEAIVDVIVDVYHPKARIIKDVSAGAVLLSSFLSVIVGYFVFFEKVSSGIEIGIEKIRQYPMHITIIAIIITLVIVLALKALIKKGTPFQGGMPSGHTAVAFSITTAVLLWTHDAKITILCLIVSLLLVQSRLESKIHTLLETAAGAVLGFLVTLLLFQIFG